MKKLFFLIITGCIFLGTAGKAQNRGAKVGLGLDLGFPMKDFGNNADYGIGGSLLYQQKISESSNFTVSLGYLQFNGKKTFGNLKYMQSFIPIKAGIRYFLAKRIFAAGEAGASLAASSGSGTYFAYAPGLGMELPVSDSGLLDLSVRYEGWTGSKGTLSFVGLRVGYSF